MSLADLSLGKAKHLLKALSTGADKELAMVRLPPHFEWSERRFEGTTFREVEASNPRLFKGFLRSAYRFEDCTFVRCVLDGAIMEKVLFVRCRFDGLDLGQKWVGSLKECSFTSCTFQGLVCPDAAFHDCAFSDCTIDVKISNHAYFGHCLFENVVMTGRVDSTNFIGCSYRRCDFSEARFTDLSLLSDPDQDGRPERDVKMPDRPDNFMISPRLFGAARARLASELSPEGLEAFDVLVDGTETDEDPECIDEAWLSELPAKDRQRVMIVLFELRHGD